MLDVFGTIFENKLDGLADVVHQFVLGAALRDGLGQLLALAAVKSRDRVVFNNNGVFCRDVFVQISICKDTK